MQPDHDPTSTQQDRPDSDRTQPGTATGGDDWSGPDVDPTPAERRVTVQEAAEALGISVEAVRARIKRGTLTKEKGSEGTVYVWLGSKQARRMHEHSRMDDSRRTGFRGDRTDDRLRPEEAVVEALREQIEMLRSEIEDRKEEARRKDAIIMSLSQRFPELPPATTGEGQEAPRRRWWLMRFFFGP